MPQVEALHPFQGSAASPSRSARRPSRSRRPRTPSTAAIVSPRKSGAERDGDDGIHERVRRNRRRSGRSSAATRRRRTRSAIRPGRGRRRRSAASCRTSSAWTCEASPATSPVMPRKTLAASICIAADWSGLLGSGAPRAYSEPADQADVVASRISARRDVSPAARPHQQRRRRRSRSRARRSRTATAAGRRTLDRSARRRAG